MPGDCLSRAGEALAVPAGCSVRISSNFSALPVVL